jgi:hypothetical protein
VGRCKTAGADVTCGLAAEGLLAVTLSVAMQLKIRLHRCHLVLKKNVWCPSYRTGAELMNSHRRWPHLWLITNIINIIEYCAAGKPQAVTSCMVRLLNSRWH